MFEHEHGEVVGIGVGDVDVLSVHVDRRRETAGVDDAHESRRNRLRAESRGDESNPRPGMGVCGTLGVVRDTCCGVTVCDCVDDTEIERAR